MVQAAPEVLQWAATGDFAPAHNPKIVVIVFTVTETNIAVLVQHFFGWVGWVDVLKMAPNLEKNTNIVCCEGNDFNSNSVFYSKQ